MAINPEDWLAMEQVMDEENHALLQVETSETEKNKQPELLLISANAVNGTSSTQTFSLLLMIGGKRALALVDSGSTHTFMNYSFAAETNCYVSSAPSQSVILVGGGKLQSTTFIQEANYSIKNQPFVSTFKLLNLQGYDIILGCDWI
jgi:hypothetical protein